jgi:tRNA(Ile2) C34 agmatinyltransferase TiaS
MIVEACPPSCNSKKVKCDWCGARMKSIGKDYTDRPDAKKMYEAWKKFFEGEDKL